MKTTTRRRESVGQVMVRQDRPEPVVYPEMEAVFVVTEQQLERLEALRAEGLRLPLPPHIETTGLRVNVWLDEKEPGRRRRVRWQIDGSAAQRAAVLPLIGRLMAAIRGEG